MKTQKSSDGFRQQNLSKRKKIVFSIFVFAITIALFFSLELTLRAFHFGTQFDLVTIEEKGGIKQYRLNHEVGKRYFSEYNVLIPEIAPETFPVQKRPETFRVFCLGGSTMASFPFEHQARWHCLLRDQLAARFPNRQIEVINVAMSAVNSFTVLDFMRELVDYEPDLFLIYMGHNEFYGALGVGSVQTFGKNRRLINAYLRLQHLKLMQLLRMGIDGLRGIFQRAYPALHPEETLMEMIVRERYIPYESEDFRIAAQSFEANLAQMIRLAQKRHIKVLVSSLVSNLSGLAPFHSIFSPNFPENARATWEAKFSLGEQAMQQQTYELALLHFENAAKTDDGLAKLHFEMARVHQARGRYDEARRSYERARDWDALRFRAPSHFNQIIKKACAQLNAPLVDMEKAFVDSSAHGIIGNQLLFEHVHPNFAGYTLMAKTFARAIIDNKFLVSPDSLNSSPLADDDVHMMKLSAVTDLDIAIGNLKIVRLIQRWPFRPEQFVAGAPAIKSDATVARLADDYINRRLAWDEAHYRLAEHYAQQQDYEKAEREYLSVIKLLPENYFPHFGLANLYFSQHRNAQAETALHEALKRNSRSAAVQAKLGMLKFLRREFGAARQQFEQALSNNLATQELSAAGIGSANYYLALTCLQTGARDEALRALQETMRWQPDHRQASHLLNLLQSNQPMQLEF